MLLLNYVMSIYLLERIKIFQNNNFCTIYSIYTMSPLLISLLLIMNITQGYYAGWGYTAYTQRYHYWHKFGVLSRLITVSNNTVLIYICRITKECVVSIKNATFNLKPLYLNSKSQLKFYTVKDDRFIDDPTDDYGFAFNICGPVSEVPTGCTYDDLQGKDRKFCDNNTLTIYPDGTTNCSVPWSTIGYGEAGSYQINLSIQSKQISIKQYQITVSNY